MKPDWDDLGEKYENSKKVLIGDVDCTVEGNKKLCEDQGVTGYPTLKYYVPGDKTGEVCEGDRSLAAMKTFVKTLGPPCSPSHWSKCNDEQKEQLKAALAEQYGVPVSMISLEATAATSRRARVLQSSGLQLKITIATTDSSGNTVDMSTLTSSVSSVNDQALASAIGGVTGTPVTVVSQPLQTSTVTVTTAFVCPRGHYCSAG